MVLNRRPRHDSENVDEIISEDDEEVGDSDSDGSEGEGSSGEEGEEDGQAEAEERARHCARMRVLLEERDRLRLQTLQEEILLQQEIARRDAVMEDVRRMEERRRQLLLVRARDLEELAALKRGDNTDTEVGVDVGSEGEME